MTYLWFKALHVVAVLAWIGALAGLVVLRLARGTEPPTTDAAALERGLFLAVANVAMVSVLFLGFGLGALGHWFAAGWLQAKLVLVLALLVLHVQVGLWAAGEGRPAPRPGRVRAAALALALVPATIALLAVLKPG